MKIIKQFEFFPSNNNSVTVHGNFFCRKVFSKMNFELAEDVINDVVAAKPGIIEKVLCMLRIKIERAKYAVIHQNEKPEADQHQGRIMFQHVFEFLTVLNGITMSHVMRKSVYAICDQQSCRSACASVQSDQRLCCSLPG